MKTKNGKEVQEKTKQRKVQETAKKPKSKKSTTEEDHRSKKKTTGEDDQQGELLGKETEAKWKKKNSSPEIAWTTGF